MRKLVLLLLVIVLSGCDSLRDADTVGLQTSTVSINGLTAFIFEFEYEGMPCLIAQRYDDQLGLTCDWSKWDTASR